MELNTLLVYYFHVSSFVFRFLILAAFASCITAFKIEELNDLQGLRFEEIGQLKLITKFKALNFHVNISTVETLINNATENLDLIAQLYKDDEKRKIDIEKLKTNLELRKLELQDILFGLIQSTRNNEHKRRKRFLDFLSSADGRNIEKDLIRIKDTINNLIDVQGGLKKYVNNVTEFINGTIEELGKRATVAHAIAVNDEVERKVNAIMKLLTRERLSGDIITIPEFQESIGNITKNLTHGEELPYRKMIEYYYNLRVTHIVDNSVIKLEMDVPIIEQSSRTLYKIIEIPARDHDKLILTDAEWKYIAINSNESMVLMSLDPCYKQSRSMFYCETQSPLKSIDSHDCVTNALVKKKIDIKLCKTAVVKSSNLTFIRLNDGQYFYYTPTNETLNITCRFEERSLSLLAQTIGILELESGCKAVANEYTLIKTVKYQESPYIKQNILSVSFDAKEIKENFKKYNTPIVDKFYVDSLNILREMAVTIPDVPKIDKLHFAASFGNSEIVMYLLMILLTIFVIHVLYKTYLWFLHKCECFKIEKRKEECKKAICDA